MIKRFRGHAPARVARASVEQSDPDWVPRGRHAIGREHFADFDPTLAEEKLPERHGLKVSSETLRGWMAEEGLWLARKQRRTFNQPRLRREREG